MNMAMRKVEKRCKIITAAFAALLVFGLFGCGAIEKGSIASSTTDPVSSIESVMTDEKKMPGEYYSTDLSYTDEYYLIHNTPNCDYDTTLVGLADKSGKVIFGIEYRGIGVTENGYFILRKPDAQQFHGDVYIIIGADGHEVGRYSWLSCQSINENGAEAYYEASFPDAQPIAPYKASNDLSDGTEEYWLLDENFQPLGERYDSLELFEDRVGATRNGALYQLDKKGNVISKTEAGVVKTLFNKYLLTIWYVSWYDGDVWYGLLDKNGKTIFEQKYCSIDMPFEDRALLYTGNMQGGYCHTVQLADMNGNILNEKYNEITYIVTDNGYIGIARCYGENAEAPVKDGQEGAWLVDKDGNRVSEKYKQIGNYTNEGDYWIYINAEYTSSPLMFQNENGTIKIVPLEDVLIKLH